MSKDGDNMSDYEVGKKRRGSIESIKEAAKGIFKRRSSKKKRSSKEMSISRGYSTTDVTRRHSVELPELKLNPSNSFPEITTPYLSTYNLPSTSTYNLPSSKFNTSTTIIPTADTDENSIEFKIRSNVFLAKIPMLKGKSLMEIQSALNYYLKVSLGGTKSAHALLQKPGHGSVAYFYLARYLVSNDVGRKKDILLKICKIMRKMYISWSEQLPALHPLVVNLNGADPTKEMMSIVNQSVYSLVKFIINTVMGKNTAPEYLYQLDYTLDTPMNEEATTVWGGISQKLEPENAYLTFLYNIKIMSLGLIEKHHYYDEVTPEKPMSNLELIRISSPLLKTPFEIEK